MPSSKRCVFGCSTIGVSVHSFPNPSKYPDQFKCWVQIAGESLSGLSDTEIHRNKKVCDKHFIESYKNRNNRLNILAVPTLFIPNLPTSEQESSDNQGHQGQELQKLEVPPHADLDYDNNMKIIPQGHLASLMQTSRQDMLKTINNDHSYCAQPRSSSETDVLPCKGNKKRAPTFFVAGHKTVQRQIKNLRSEICRLKKKCKNFKSRLAAAEKLSHSRALAIITKKMKLPAKLITNMQFREASKKPKGHRFTMDEKIMCLSFYKRSPRAYSLYHKALVLPSANSLKNLLAKIKISPGINKVIFEQLKQTVDNMSDDDRLCTLIFDEMSINPQIQYNAPKDELKGFTTIGRSDIANHVLTFMVRGVKKNFKQPVAYFFTQCLNKIDLKNTIKDVVKHVLSTGLKIVATVCDQSSVNVGAVESLVDDAKSLFLKKGQAWRQEVIVIGGKKIVPLYDVPHIFKGIRNNLITKDLVYFDPQDKKTKTVKWEHFQKLYEADKCYGELRILQKLTDEHVNPDKINKMKVKTATQMFSHSVAIAAKHLVDAGKLEPSCQQITPFVMFMDKLFDSLNSNTFQPINGKIYRAGIKVNSPHHQMWQEALMFLKNVKFIEKKKDGNKIRLVERNVPSLKNLIKTLEGMQYIWKLLSKKHSFDIMLCRNFNQDPIENFFGNIRSLGARNVSPNVVAFEGAYKSLLLKSFTTSQSTKSNCEDDMATFLQSVDFFLTSAVEEQDSGANEEININEDLLNFEINDSNDPESYVCGWVLKKCCSKIKQCLICKKNMFATQALPCNAFIKAKEYDHSKKWLCYPSKELKKCFCEIEKNTVNILKKINNPKDVKKNIKLLNEIFVNFSIFECSLHKNVQKYFEDTVINILVYSWCRSVNRILSGKCTYDGDDEMKLKAQLYFNKQKHNKNKK